ncbi:GNAT family N-acetyltransferase [Akkermansiaceae bacterium]|nr:GNAT family N-acetyltransferase [Akkermansiaceae bacterium]
MSDDARTATTVIHLEMCARGCFAPSPARDGLSVERIMPPNPARNLELYKRVGAQWQWTDKLTWTDADWRRYASRDEVLTYVGRLAQQEIGYFELEVQDAGNVEIAYFGLFPEHIGKGLGGAFLSAAVQIAWELPGTERVWVHTCARDHQHALANYLKRGFALFETQ